jgi:hypothetical protein
MIANDQIEQGPLMGASREKLLPYLKILEKASGLKVFVCDYESGYGAYLFSFVAKEVVCLVREDQLVRNQQFFKAPNLRFIKEGINEQFEMTFDAIRGEIDENV